MTAATEARESVRLMLRTRHDTQQSSLALVAVQVQTNRTFERRVGRHRAPQLTYAELREQWR